MARRIHYRIDERSDNRVTDQEWEQIKRLEHWYNSEFIWTAGRLAFKMYAIFPNWESFVDSGHSGWEEIWDRYRYLRNLGLLENEVVVRLEKEGLVVHKKGGYRDNCVASGFTRVAGNEFNAYLVCEFLLKCSMIARQAEIQVLDEGDFIKGKNIVFRNGFVKVPVQNPLHLRKLQEWVQNRRIFSVVDSSKYENLPEFRNVVQGFNTMEENERRRVLQDWNWLGFANNYDLDGDDCSGYDLNKKVRGMEIVAPNNDT